jgi:hypothetical protein
MGHAGRHGVGGRPVPPSSPVPATTPLKTEAKPAVAARESPLHSSGAPVVAASTADDAGSLGVSAMEARGNYLAEFLSALNQHMG